MPLSALTTTDLVALIEQRAHVRLQYIATTGGGEYAGPCPFCQAGTDRLRVWPRHERPHYWCRSCHRSGDCIAFLRDYEGLFFHQACQELDIDPGDYIQSCQRPSPDDPPCKEWQARAFEFIHIAQMKLWSPSGAAMLDYLHGRGFTDETIKAAQLGYCPVWYHDSLEAWGIQPEQTTKSQITIPPGIIIPWLAQGAVWKLAVKRPDASPDYGQVVGSREGLYLADSLQGGKPSLLVEGEFDALSVLQEASDLISVVATGSTTRARTHHWLSSLSQSSHVLIAYDADQAGDDGASWWLSALSNAIRWQPWDHDPNDMLTSAQDISRWVKMGLETATKPIAPTDDLHCVICGAEVEWYTPANTLYCDTHYPLHGERADGHPWPARLDSYSPCSHCGCKEWRQRPQDGRWLCSCFWTPLARSQPVPILPKPKTWDDYL